MATGAGVAAVGVAGSVLAAGEPDGLWQPVMNSVPQIAADTKARGVGVFMGNLFCLG
jgi:hypothetical protein